MNRTGVLFGLFIIAMGVLTLEPSLDKESNDLIHIRGVMVKAAYLRLWGIIVIMLGFFILIFSLLVP